MFVCTKSRNFHICESDECQNMVRTRDGVVCPISGFMRADQMLDFPHTDREARKIQRMISEAESFNRRPLSHTNFLLHQAVIKIMETLFFSSGRKRLDDMKLKAISQRYARSFGKLDKKPPYILHHYVTLTKQYRQEVLATGITARNGMSIDQIEHLINPVSNLVVSTIAPCTLEAIRMKEPYLPNTHICVIITLMSRGYYHGDHQYIQPLPELGKFLPSQAEVCQLLQQKIPDTRAEHIIRDVLDRTVKQRLPLSDIEKLLTNEELRQYESMLQAECGRKRKISQIKIVPVKSPKPRTPKKKNKNKKQKLEA